jgi:hypothetical protein
MGKLTSDILLKRYSRPVFEAKKPKKVSDADQIKIDLEDALNIAENKIGGTSSDSKEATFQAIKQILDRVPVELIDKSNTDPTLQRIFYHMTDPEKVKLVDEYVKNQSKEMDDIISKTEAAEGIQKIISRDKKFISDFNRSAAMVVRFEKLYKIYQPESAQLESDSDTHLLKSLRAIGAVINLDEIGQVGSGKIKRIGGIDSDLDPDSYEIETEAGLKLLSKDTIRKIVKESSGASKRVESEHAKRMQDISTESVESVNKWYDWASQTFGKMAGDLSDADDIDAENKIDSIRDFSNETNDIVFNMVFNYNDQEVELEQEIERAEERIDSTGRRGIREKKSVFRRIKETLANAALPVVSNGEIQRPGDYYRLFNALKAEKPDWMSTVLLRDVFGGSADQYNRFKTNEDSEKATESYQTDYLDACAAWTYRFIEEDYMSEFNDKEMTEYKRTIESIVLEKKKEIKNYYLSKGFNLGNFNSVRIDPEIDLPLYKKMPLAVSEKDRKEESSLRNMLTGLGSAALHFFGGGIEVDMAKIQSGARFKEMDKKVFQGLNQFVKGAVGAIGGKEAARKYQKGSDEMFGKKEAVKEDMLSPMDSPSATMTPIEGPGQTFQTPMSMSTDMDMMSLAGPMGGGVKSRKTKKKKKSKSNKSERGYGSVLDFQSFLKSR